MNNILTGKRALGLSAEGRINLIYGQSGNGKTTFALTATKDQKVLYIDVENAIGKVWAHIPDEDKNIKNLSSYKPKNIEELITFINGQDSRKYDLIILDSLTFLVEQELGAITDQGKRLSFNDYGSVANDYKQCLRTAQLKGINLDIIMQADRIETESGSMVYYPRSAGKQIVPATVERADNIIFLERTDKGQFVAHTVPGTRWHAKHRDPLPDKIENPTYNDLSKHFVKYKVENATEAQMKEMIVLIGEAKVQDINKFQNFIGYNDKGITMSQYELAIKTLNDQINSNKLKDDTRDDNSK